MATAKKTRLVRMREAESERLVWSRGTKKRSLSYEEAGTAHRK